MILQGDRKGGMRGGHAAGAPCFSARFTRGNLNIIRLPEGGMSMGAFILGLIVGAGGALTLFIYDEGEMFLKLSRQIKQTAERYRQSP
jgi:hypothetical protein